MFQLGILKLAGIVLGDRISKAVERGLDFAQRTVGRRLARVH